jgi:hypothetical protein
MSADYATLGALFSFTKDSGIYAIAYGLWNDIAARYSPFPLIDSQHQSAAFLPNTGEISYGSDTRSIGLGFVHVFNVGLTGKDMTKPPPEKPKEAPAATTAPAETAAPVEKPEEKKPDELPPSTDAEEPEETEEKPPAAKP